MKDCGCNINDDGIDTDILFELPQNVFDLIGKKIGLKSGTKYDNDVKNKIKEDAKLNNKNLREYLTEIPLVSKQIITIEKMKQGGILKFQKGKKTPEGLQTEHGMIYNAKVEKPVKFDDLPYGFQDAILNKPSVKPKKLGNDMPDDEGNIKALTDYVFPKNIDEEQKGMILNEFMEQYPEKADRLNYGDFTDRDVNELKLFSAQKLKQDVSFAPSAFKKYQMGGLSSMGNITTGNHNMNRLGQMMMVNNLYKPEMQQGGKLDQKAFIKWLASKLGVNSKEEFEAAVQQMGEDGLKQAQQMYMQESTPKAEHGMMFKKGGIFKYQRGGGFRPFAKQEARVAEKDNKSYRYVPGTYDSTQQSANQYNNVTSTPQYSAVGSQGQSKINYEQGVGQRTQSGLAGNRGTEGVNLTDRLAKERQELQSNWDKYATDENFKKRLIKGKDGKTYVTDSTGKYNLGLYQEKTPTLPPPPITDIREYAIGIQPTATGSAIYPEVFDVRSGKKERVTKYDRQIPQSINDILTQYGGRYDKTNKTVIFKDKTYPADSIPVLFDEKTRKITGIK